MKGLWWKLLSIVLMLYVVIAGMLVPLAPGIQAVSPRNLEAGTTSTLAISAYNTSFSADDKLRVWLKLGSPGAVGQVDTALRATSIRVVNPQQVEATFTVPAYLPEVSTGLRATLLVDDPQDGAFVLPSAIQLSPKPDLVGAADPNRWLTKLDDLHESQGFTYPYRGLLSETIRNQYFHVSLWFALMLLMLAAAVYALRYLLKGDPELDRKSEALTRVGLGFGLLGLVTGMVWANYTWGKPWSGDIKQNMTAVALLIYSAYFVLRGSLGSAQQASRVGAAYNIFAFVMLIPLLYVIPRMRDSLHPGAGGNPGFGGEDLDNTMRMVFYPGIIGFTLLGLWIAQLYWRTARLANRVRERTLR